MSIDVDLSLIISDKSLYFSLSIFRSKGTDDIISLYLYFLSSQFIVVVFDQILLKLHADCDSFILDDLVWGKVWYEVDFLINRRVYDLLIGSHIVESSSKYHSDSVSSYSQSWSSTVQSCISNTQNDYVPFQLE